MSDKDQGRDISISASAVALSVENDQSLTGVLVASGMRMRDFIILSFVANQGPIDCERVAGIAGLDLDTATACIQRLMDAELIDEAPHTDAKDNQLVVTGLGQVISDRITNQA